MYSCSRCKSDVTAEVERIISGIISGSRPGKSAPPVKMEYFEQRYECRACTNRLYAAESAAYRAGKRPVERREEGPPGVVTDPAVQPATSPAPKTQADDPKLGGVYRR